jgi:hypothetical protein
MMARKRKVDLPATLVDHSGMAKRVSVKRRHRSIPPTSRATLLCDRVIKDAFTGTVTIVGALTRVGVTGIPGHSTPFFVFTQLTGGLGHHQLYVQVTEDHRRGRVVVRSAPMGVSFENEGEVRDIIFQVPPVPIERAGSYTVTVLSENDVVATQHFDTPPEA